jgi:hypothetical protein
MQLQLLTRHAAAPLLQALIRSGIPAQGRCMPFAIAAPPVLGLCADAELEEAAGRRRPPTRVLAAELNVARWISCRRTSVHQLHQGAVWLAASAHLFRGENSGG